MDVTYRERVLGSVLAGAVGDALGAAIEFDSIEEIRRRHGREGVRGYVEAYGRPGAITDDTQMTLFTMEGLIRASVRWRGRGVCHPASVVRNAYLRWLSTQQTYGVAGVDESVLTSGWLVHERGLHSRRAPGNTCLSGLASGRFGTPTEPLNHSKGCGGVMRVAPVGMVLAWSPEKAFDEACAYAALSHGHPTGWLAAGALAFLVRRIVDGEGLADACHAALESLRGRDHHEETSRAIEAALDLARTGEPTSEKVEKLGGAWVGDEALAIAIYAALTARDLRSGLLVAVNHSGDSDSTGAIAGNLLGALQGIGAVPDDLLAELELRPVITALAEDFVSEFSGERDDDPPGWAERYPGG